MRCLIDGDIITYRCGFAAERMLYNVYTLDSDEVLASFNYKKEVNSWLEASGLSPDEVVIEKYRNVEPIENSLHNVDSTIEFIAKECSAAKLDVYLTGKGNYREKLATIRPYKGNRDKDSRPFFYDEIRQHMINVYDAKVVDNKEADDAIGIEHYNSEDTIICSLDKDLNMIPGYHYNWATNLKYFVSENEAMTNFYRQLLMGDSTDNIQGVPSVGAKTAEKLIPYGMDEEDMYSIVLDKYKVAFGNYQEALTENANLLWIQRVEGVLWQPPI